MTKISKKSAYPIKSPVKGDYFVGTDSESFGKTVNFGFEDAVNLINTFNGTHIIDYRFRTDINIDLTVLTDGFFLSKDNVTTVDSVTKFYVNKNNIHETDLSELFDFIKDNNEYFYFKLQKHDSLTSLAYFNITSVEDNISHFIFNVSLSRRSQNMTNLVDYKMYFLGFEEKSTISKTSELINDGDGASPFITEEILNTTIDSNKDKNYYHDQAIPSDTWAIVHNLGKKPSVTVIDTAGTEVEGEVKHISLNEVKIMFSAAFSGNATLN